MLKQSPFWLAIDIGNTQTVAGLFAIDLAERRLELHSQIRFKTDAQFAARDWAHRLADLLRHIPERIIVASVVPAVRSSLAETFRDRQWMWVDSKTPLSFTLALPYPEQLGADRIANVAGALGRFSPPFIIVDAGTATTFCMLDSQRCYIGGAIAPGMEISFQALATRAARLFEVEWSPPQSPIGNTTESQLQSGLLYGHESLIDGMTTRLLQAAGAEFKNAKRILTGGCSHLLDLSAKGFEFIPTLTLEGLIRIALENSR